MQPTRIKTAGGTYSSMAPVAAADRPAALSECAQHDIWSEVALRLDIQRGRTLAATLRNLRKRFPVRTGDWKLYVQPVYEAVRSREQSLRERILRALSTALTQEYIDDAATDVESCPAEVLGIIAILAFLRDSRTDAANDARNDGFSGEAEQHDAERHEWVRGEALDQWA